MAMILPENRRTAQPAGVLSGLAPAVKRCLPSRATFQKLVEPNETTRCCRRCGAAAEGLERQRSEDNRSFGLPPESASDVFDAEIHRPWNDAKCRTTRPTRIWPKPVTDGRSAASPIRFGFSRCAPWNVGCLRRFCVACCGPGWRSGCCLDGRNGRPFRPHWNRIPATLRHRDLGLPDFWRRRLRSALARCLTFWPDRLGAPHWQQRIRYEGLHHVLTVLNDGAPAVLATLHFGVLFLLRYFLRARGIAASVLVAQDPKGGHASKR